MQEYITRNIDKQLIAWKEDSMRKPLLLRGSIGDESWHKEKAKECLSKCTNGVCWWRQYHFRQPDGMIEARNEVFVELVATVSDRPLADGIWGFHA